MFKNKVVICLFMGISMVSAAWAQEKPEHLIKSITGTVTSTDAVGNIISIRTEDRQQMSFVVPDKANITQQTKTIGLMDIGKSDSVNIQYYQGLSSKYFVVSIIDNESVVNE